MVRRNPHEPAVRLMFLAVLALATRAWCSAPVMYHQPGYQSPIRALPDDLLLLAGDGLNAGVRIVYRNASTDPLPHPEYVPTRSDDSLGTAEVVSTAAAPFALTVRLPQALRADRSYALWAVNAAGEWSAAVLVNDTRPLWLSPATVYSSASVAGLPRYLKVIGRNLEPHGRRMRIRLLGPADITIEARPAALEDAALDHFVAQAELPAKLPAGLYRVQVAREGANWVELEGQALRVRENAQPGWQGRIDEARFGGCKAAVASDAGLCVRAAIAAAQAAGGGNVLVPPGRWHLSARGDEGFIVPPGVNILGAGRALSTIVSDANGVAAGREATFTLLGRNRVEGLTFLDTHRYSSKIVDAAILKLGRSEDAGRPGSPPIEDIIISNNRFARANVAVSDAGLPIRRLYVTFNEFAAYRSGLELAGSRYLVNRAFNDEDSVITHNLFKPGSYLDVAIGQGALASEIGASRHLDFSNNTADGSALDGLDAVGDPRGWRAAFFWHMNNNQEMMLVSENYATCTGDKDGDGEAFSYDNNANTFGLDSAQIVVAATHDTVTVAGPLATRQNDRDLAIDDYYVGHWVQVGQGRGLGQVRKITAYHIAPEGVTLRVAPGWDVIPDAQHTRISVGREFWQVYTIANVVDHRRPLCAKSNRTYPKGGSITVWGQMADSAVEGNRQFDTDGILFQQYYNEVHENCGECDRITDYKNFLEIRGNRIDGEYDWEDDCSSSGIFGSIAVAPAGAPVTVSVGVSIDHNEVIRADGMRGAAISMLPTWYQGPAPHRWPIVEGTLIFKNSIQGFDAAAARACKHDVPHPRTAIDLGGSSLIENSVLYANECPGARRALELGTGKAQLVCTTAHASCGCAAQDGEGQ